MHMDPGMTTASARERVSAQARKIVERLRALGSELRQAPPEMDETICRFAGVLKEEGVPREQIIVILQTAIESNVAAGDISDELRDDVVLRCLEQYDR